MHLLLQLANFSHSAMDKDLRSDPDGRFLCYGDVVLRNADVTLLTNETCWLNDVSGQSPSTRVQRPGAIA